MGPLFTAAIGIAGYARRVETHVFELCKQLDGKREIRPGRRCHLHSDPAHQRSCQACGLTR